jgi:hypothetical protein
MFHIDGNATLRSNGEGGCLCAARANFFLDSANGINTHLWVEPSVLAKQAKRLGNDKQSGFVIEPASNRTIANQELEVLLVRDDVP